MKLNKQIHQWLNSHRAEGIALLTQLVQTESTQGNEAQAQKIVLHELKKLGLEIDMWEPDGQRLKQHSFFASPRTNFSGSPNLVGVLKGSGGGRSIILNGHIDVVPSGELEQWEQAPFSAHINEGRLYGRGATDMKGGNVALILAMKALQALNIQLKGDVIFESVIEEESGGAGTLAAIVRGYKADAALIPEPTNMKIFPKQQGSMWFRLHIKGRSAHGGTRYQGVCAIEKSLLVLNHIKELEKKRNERITDILYHDIPIPVPINIGKIEGGEWPSSVADLVKVEGRMGVAPDEPLEVAKEEMKKWLVQLEKVDPWFIKHPVKLEWFGARWLPGAIDINHPLMTILARNYEEVIQKSPVIEASPWGTDGGLLSSVGETPTIVFGPGVTEKAHYPNEYIDLDRVFETAEIIALTLIDWCEEKEQL
ncbi:peptidase [Halalkalibacter akibai]|uniref:Acetylornithine deacetylase n=1 Tax=Halalkalibacter akibai (strain ATCC 43226 / DSM 21942 / CIP 109018 / JCM 9157 / 1139) TaxID=1236973 RepID=W4QXZ7_HALA3|nr:peptidase [Halalkalibacter akibai]GAE36951.1 acetylornithine deacetylase [Halalkalibacter akibai JCM 9157]